MTDNEEKHIFLKLSPMDAKTSFITSTISAAGFGDRCKSIHEAARLNDSVLLRIGVNELKDDVPDQINDLNEEGLSALHYAVRYGHIKCIETILDAKEADVNVIGAQGEQPIHFAAKFFKDRQKQQGRTGIIDHSSLENAESTLVEENVISVLLNRGANINAIDAYGLTPLRYAAQKGIVSALTILLKNDDIDIEKEDTSGATALHSACLKGHVDAAKILIQHGANILLQDKKGMNCLHYAAVGNNGLKVLQQIFLEMKENNKKKISETITIPQLLSIPNIEDETLLHLAVAANWYETSKLLLDEGADVNQRKPCNGITPLHLAASKAGNVNIVKLLVERGANVQVQDAIAETPLHKAARNNQVEIVEYLLEMGSKVDAIDQDGQTALTEAAAKNNSKILKILLDNGATIDILDQSHKSSVYWAAENNAIEVLKQLLPRLQQSDRMDMLEERDTFSNSPLHIAAMKGHEDVVCLLIEYGAEVDSHNDQERTPLHSAAAIGEIAVAKALINEKPSIINDRTGGENTSVHLATKNGQDKMLKYLLDAGSDIDPKDSVGLTPLSHAAMLGYLDCVKVLLVKRASTSIRDLNGRTPMFLACEKGHASVMQLLLNRGADVCVLDNKNLSMLDLAIQNIQEKAVEVLLNHEKFFDLMRSNFVLNGRRTTPMREMIYKLPNVAYKVLNKCMVTESCNTVEIMFNYELIDDKFAEWNQSPTTSEEIKSKKMTTVKKKTTDALFLTDLMADELENQQIVAADEIKKILEQEHPLSVMCKEENGALLSHPLVSSLIDGKWERFGRPVFYSKFALFAIFLIFLTGYLLTITLYLSYWEVFTTTKQYLGGSNITCKKSTLSRDTFNYMSFVTIGSWVILVLSCFQLLLEVIQMINRKLSYFCDAVNWLEWSMYIMAILYMKKGERDMDSTPDGCKDAENTRMLGACTAFLAWIDLLLFTRKFATFGIYIVMFSDVLKTFLKFSLTFSMFVMAFGLGFYSFFSYFQVSFGDIARTFVKSIAMSIGEFGFDDLFSDRSYTFVPVLVWILFFVFLIVMTILLMNMLVGLAVDDIKAVLEKAVITRIIMQVQLVLDVEKTIPDQFQKKFFIRNKKVVPDERERFWKARDPSIEEIEEAWKCTKLKQVKEKED